MTPVRGANHEENSSSDGSLLIRYAMIHLDDDDIPELAIPLGNSHSMGVGYYAYDRKEVKRVYVAGSFGTAYYEKNTGVVLGFYSGMGSYYTAIGVIKDGELTEGGIITIRARDV